MFSVTHNDKFTLQDKNYAIWNHQNVGPVFGGYSIYSIYSGYSIGYSGGSYSGGSDLGIGDKANQGLYSCSYVNHTYNNNNYKKGDKKSYERFCGNPNNYNFAVTEWEVWQVEFA